MVEHGMREVYIEVVETGAQIKMQRQNKVYVMDLTLDDGKKSAGFSSAGTNPVSPMLRLVKIGAMAEDSGAGIGAASAPGKQMRSSWIIAKKKRVKKQQFVLQRFLVVRVRKIWLRISRRMNRTELGARNVWLGVGSAVNRVSKSRMIVLCLWSVWTTAIWLHEGIRRGLYGHFMWRRQLSQVVLRSGGVKNYWLQSCACIGVVARWICTLWCSQVTRNKRTLLFEKAMGRHLAGQFDTSLVPQDNSVDYSAGNGLGEDSVWEVDAKL